MSVKFNGLNKLDKNCYDNIVIKENPDNGDYQVNVKGETLKYGLQTTLPISFSKRIKKLSDEQKISEVINYFLENHQITLIGIKIVSYNNRYSRIESNYASLLLQMYHPLTEFSACITKYQKDRAEFLQQHSNITNYIVSTSFSESSYNLAKYDDKEAIYLKVKTTRENIWNVDKNFLKEFIHEKLANNESEAYPSLIVYGTYAMQFNKDLAYAKIRCGDLEFIINDQYLLDSVVYEVVKEYKESLQEQKTKQLKMEGF